MSSTLLLIVDMQNAIADQKPYMFAEVLANIKTLLEKFRDSNQPVIFIQHDDGIGSDLELGTKGWEIVPEIAPGPNNRVIYKHFNSAFKETTLEKELFAMNIKQLIIVGMQTEFCIDTTVRVAFEKGFKVIIPEMTNTTVDDNFLSAKEIYNHHQNLFNNRFGTVVRFNEVLGKLNENDYFA